MKTLPVITLIAGFLLGILTMVFYNSLQFSTHVKRTIFDECFQYYANTHKEEGITKELISTCWNKTDSWLKEIRK